MSNAIQTKSKILIVEDMAIVAEDLRLKLKRMGYDIVGTVESGDLAIRQAFENNPDMILMDIQLKGRTDGIEAAEKIRYRQNIPIVFLTGNTDQETVQRAKLSEAYGFIVKPFDERELHATIEMALHKHSMERQQVEHRQWLTTVLGSIGDAVITTDVKHRVTYLNPAAEILTGWLNEDAFNLDISVVLNLISEETKEAIDCPTRQAIKENKVIWVEEGLLMLSKSGKELFIEDSAAPLVNFTGEVNGAVLTFRNVTEKKELQSRLKQSQKMEAIGRLAGGIAHDFNNLLTVVLGYSDMVLDNLYPEDENYRKIEIIKQSGERAAKLTAQLLAFSRKQVLRAEILSLNSIVAEMIPILTRLIGEDIELTANLSKNLKLISVDSTQIEQILLNLIANARDAMPKGGKVIIETANVFLDENYTAHHFETAPGHYVMLSVSDNGEGISGEVKANIFEPFFTTKEVGRGTGLGLATIYGIVKQSGGNIWLYSEKNVGTTLKIYLPVVGESDLAETFENNFTYLKSEQEASSKTILVVEDEQMLRELTSEILQNGGYNVITAASGSEALEICRHQEKSIDLVVTDVIMPGMNGSEFVKYLKASRPGIKTLYMSGYTNDVIARHGILESDILFIEKPFTTNLLLRKIREVLAT